MWFPFGTAREPVSKSWIARYGWVSLPTSAPTANLLAGLVIVSLRMSPNGNAPLNGGSATTATGSGRPATSVPALPTAASMSAWAVPFTPITKTTLWSPMSRMTLSMTALISPTPPCPTIMLTTNDGGLLFSTLFLSLSR